MSTTTTAAITLSLIPPRSLRLPILHPVRYPPIIIYSNQLSGIDVLDFIQHQKARSTPACDLPTLNTSKAPETDNQEYKT